jgi:hypothetical protein
MIGNKFLYLLSNLHRLPRFLLDYMAFKRQKNDWQCSIRDMLPILDESTPQVQFDAHYIYHTAWAARVLRELAPAVHVDISSSLMFVAMASAHTPVKHYDYRTPTVTLPGLECGVADLSKLTFADNSIASLSCMHVIEHIGLGRYGDPIDAVGDRRAASELQRVLAPNGHLLLVVPLAEQSTIRFNGHRIYDLARIRAMFDGLELLEFSFLNEARANQFTRHASISDVAGSQYGCGCFLFRKPGAVA